MNAIQTAAPQPQGVTLGILAGGKATRLGGLDKAWLLRDDTPQVVRIAALARDGCEGVIVSANRDLQRYTAEGLRIASDRHTDIGPLAGIDALANACGTPWLLTLPVDVLDVPDELLAALRAAGVNGGFAEDDDGPQPLVALWPVVPLLQALDAAIQSQDYAVHALQRRLGMTRVRIPGVRFGNLNTPAALRAAGIAS